MKTFRLRTLLCVFAVLAAAMAYGAAIAYPIAVERGAPYQITYSECLICGRSRTIERRWKASPKETIVANPNSVWMQPKIDDEHDHWWVGSSSEGRSNWFDDSYISCGGGIGGVSSPHDLATKRGDDVARPFVVQYLGLLKEGDLDAIRNFVRTDVSQALQDPPVANLVVQ
ncbi:MAG: hypothetical protein ACI93T_004265 [Porticoccaceae bacterium]|jgi:hypothetical protein